MLIKNRKGLLTLAFAMFLVIITAITTTILYSVLNQHILLTENIKTSLQNRYYAECGVYRALWLINNGYLSAPFTESITTSDPGAATLNITVTLDTGPDPDIYNILSQVMEGGSPVKTITVAYDTDRNIQSWR